MANPFPTPIPKIEVLVHRVSGDIEIEQFHTEREARDFCEEEVKWENTKRVICERIKFDEAGDFESMRA